MQNEFDNPEYAKEIIELKQKLADIIEKYDNPTELNSLNIVRFFLLSGINAARALKNE